jgi:hypothetical protein
VSVPGLLFFWHALARYFIFLPPLRKVGNSSCVCVRSAIACVNLICAAGDKAGGAVLLNSWGQTEETRAATYASRKVAEGCRAVAYYR